MLTECSRLTIARLVEPFEVTWTEEADGLVGVDVLPSGALAIFVRGKTYEWGGRQRRDPARIAHVAPFGTWVAFDTDAAPPAREKPAQ